MEGGGIAGNWWVFIVDDNGNPQPPDGLRTCPLTELKASEPVSPVDPATLAAALAQLPGPDKGGKPASQGSSPAEAAGPPDVSQLAPAEAARTLANWNYDRENWTHAIEHYEEAIARGAAGRVLPAEHLEEWQRIDRQGNELRAVRLEKPRMRCALIDGALARCYAGVGVVEGSDPAAELAEMAFQGLLDLG